MTCLNTSMPAAKESVGTSSSTGTTPSTTKTLSQLHEIMCQTLAESSQETLFDYLLDSIEFLKTGDVRAWMQRFTPSSLPPPPVRPPASTLAEKSHCVDCGCPVVLDVTNNIAVCQDCGTVAEAVLLLNDAAHTTIPRLKSIARQMPHIYSRLTHFRSYALQLAGNSWYRLNEKDAGVLRRAIDGMVKQRKRKKNPPPITPDDMEAVLRKKKLTRKYLFHRISLARKFGGYQPERIDGGPWLYMYRLFKRLNVMWRYHAHWLAPRRKVFMNYPFVFFQLCHIVGKPNWCKDLRMIKGISTRNFHCVLWQRVCGFLGQPFVFTPLPKKRRNKK